MPGQGSPGAARLLRLPCRALEASAHVEPDREHLRHGAPPNHPRQRLSLESDGAGHGVQARRGRPEKLATPRRAQPVAEARARCQVHRRARERNRRSSAQSRRLNPSRRHQDLAIAQGRRRVVRHGHLPEREVMTGIGPVAVRQPRDAIAKQQLALLGASASRRRSCRPTCGARSRSRRCCRSSTSRASRQATSRRRWQPARRGCRGALGIGHRPSEGRLAGRPCGLAERDLSARRYVYVWADGIYLQARLADEKQCILVLIGATPEGRKELVGFSDGARESANDWRDLCSI